MVDLHCVGDFEMCLCAGGGCLLILICLLNSLSEYNFCLCILIYLLIVSFLPTYFVSSDFIYQGGLQTI